jgi:hypothetical protein
MTHGWVTPQRRWLVGIGPTPRWGGGTLSRVELRKGDRPNPPGVDGYVVFRVRPPEPEPGETRRVTVDWAQLRPKVPPKKRKPQPEE